MIGRGRKSIIWYWEIDRDNESYYDFLTTNLDRAVKIFATEKTRMWEHGWVGPAEELEE